MRNTIDDSLASWRQSGSEMVLENAKIFHGLVAEAERFERQGHYDMAAIYADTAAEYAFSHHPGIFASSRIEKLLLRLAAASIPRSANIRSQRTRASGPERVLHVATGLTPIGGITSLIWRWIRQDAGRSHSFVMTRQVRHEVPEDITKAVTNSGGRVYRLNNYTGSMISWAERLGKLASAADLVVLHSATHDVIPIIALANPGRPPVVYVNHADHVLSLGVSTSDIFVNLRESGKQLSQQRRGVAPERNRLLPTLIDVPHRARQREEAKRQLGAPADSVVLLSIARKVKFRSINGMSYADAHLPLLEKYKRAILITVGSGHQEDWSEAMQRVQGRIIAVGEQEKPHPFFEAADIYVDSFPFISNTSLLEAGSYGLPLVSRYPFTAGCEVLGADMPGFSDTLARVSNKSEYETLLSRLIEDENFRLDLGEATRKNICEAHVGMNWQRSLEDLYSSAIEIPRSTTVPPCVDEMRLEDIDVFTSHVHNSMCDGRIRDVQDILRSRLRVMPFAQCVQHGLNLAKGRGVRRWSDELPYMVPEWLLCRTRLLWKGRQLASGRG